MEIPKRSCQMLVKRMNQKSPPSEKAPATLDLSAEKPEDLLDAHLSTEGVPSFGEQASQRLMRRFLSG